MSNIACGSDEPAPPPKCVVEIGDSPQRGPADAWVTIVEFADFQCSYCGKAEPTIAALDAERPGLRWVFKHFPLTSPHPRALPAALAAHCADDQNSFWQMHDLLFANQGKLDESSLAAYADQLGLDLAVWNDCRQSDAANARIYADYDLGLRVGVTGTPTFFVNGIPLPGAYPLNDFIEAVDEAEHIAKRSGASSDCDWHVQRTGGENPDPGA